MQSLRFVFFMTIMLIVVGLNNSQIFAQVDDTNNFTKIQGKDIQNNPVAQNMLKKIEESYKILAQLQSGYIPPKVTESQKFVEEQRKIANDQLTKDLASMNKEYEGFTSDAAFSNFVSKVDAPRQVFYSDQYDYFKSKMKIANNVKQLIIDNGGTYKEAQAEYIKYASMSRTEMIRIVSDLNIKHGLTIAERQSYFDENGKLPRYEDDLYTVCFNCQEYEPLVQKIIFESPTLNKLQ